VIRLTIEYYEVSKTASGYDTESNKQQMMSASVEDSSHAQKLLAMAAILLQPQTTEPK
jgi:hypothetical protein